MPKELGNSASLPQANQGLIRRRTENSAECAVGSEVQNAFEPTQQGISARSGHSKEQPGESSHHQQDQIDRTTLESRFRTSAQNPTRTMTIHAQFTLSATGEAIQHALANAVMSDRDACVVLEHDWIRGTIKVTTGPASSVDSGTDTGYSDARLSLLFPSPVTMRAAVRVAPAIRSAFDEWLTPQRRFANALAALNDINPIDGDLSDLAYLRAIAKQVQTYAAKFDCSKSSAVASRAPISRDFSPE